MSTVYLNIGSNRGDRRAIIGKAIGELAGRYPRAEVRRSPWVESRPWGYESASTFVNIGVALDFESAAAMPDPFGLLRTVKDIEHSLAPGDAHRDADGNYSDRHIDIDIIAIDNISIDSEELTVPHPRAAARDFVMRPMQFLCPGWNPANARPTLKKTIEEMCRDTVEMFKAKAKTPVTVVLDNIRSVVNIGSIFRTADAFAVEHVMLCGICATPPSAEIHKTALGAEMSVDWSYHATTAEALAELRGRGYTICCLEQVKGSVSLEEFVPEARKKYALIVGNEVSGVDEAIVSESDLYIEIPQSGTKHSLNVAVSTAVALWTFYSKTLH